MSFTLIGCDGMLMAQQKHLLRRRRAYHEGGHVAAALQFGIPIIIVTRCLFVGSVALNAKASVGAALEERSHPLNDANPQGAALR